MTQHDWQPANPLRSSTHCGRCGLGARSARCPECHKMIEETTIGHGSLRGWCKGRPVFADRPCVG